MVFYIPGGCLGCFPSTVVIGLYWPESESGAVPVSFLFSNKKMEVPWVFSINGLHEWVWGMVR